MILDSFLGELTVLVSYHLVIHANAVIGQRLTMSVVYTLAYLQKFEIIFDSFLVLFDIVVKNSNWIIRSTLVSNFTGSSAPKSQHFIILKSSHSWYVNRIIDFLGVRNVRYMLAVCLVQTWFLLQVTGRSIEK